MSNSLRPHGQHHAKLPCPLPTPGACLNSCPLSYDAIQPSHPLSPLSLLPSIFPRIRVFSNESPLHIRWTKYRSSSFSISSPSSESSGLFSTRVNWFDLLVVQGTLKNLLQHLSSKASVLWHTALYGPKKGPYY